MASKFFRNDLNYDWFFHAFFLPVLERVSSLYVKAHCMLMQCMVPFNFSVKAIVERCSHAALHAKGQQVALQNAIAQFELGRIGCRENLIEVKIPTVSGFLVIFQQRRCFQSSKAIFRLFRGRVFHDGNPRYLVICVISQSPSLTAMQTAVQDVMGSSGVVERVREKGHTQ